MNAIIGWTRLLVAAAVLCVGASAWGQDGSGGLYTWTDKNGVVHVTDSLGKVPMEYRSATQQLDQGTSGGNVEIQSQSPASPAAPAQGGGNDAALKAQWQSRMLDAKRRLQYAQNKYGQLYARKMDLQAQWGSAGAALPPQSVLDEMNRLDADMANVKAEIDKAQDQINNVIPDEARRAGIPPGWLRDVE